MRLAQLLRFQSQQHIQISTDFLVYIEEIYQHILNYSLYFVDFNLLLVGLKMCHHKMLSKMLSQLLSYHCPRVEQDHFPKVVQSQGGGGRREDQQQGVGRTREGSREVRESKERREKGHEGSTRYNEQERVTWYSARRGSGGAGITREARREHVVRTEEGEWRREARGRVYTNELFHIRGVRWFTKKHGPTLQLAV